MKLYDLIPLVGNTVYGVFKPEPEKPNYSLIIGISTACVGVIAGIIILIKKKHKKSNQKKNDGPEDLYGCPRPDEMDGESKEIEE